MLIELGPRVQRRAAPAGTGAARTWARSGGRLAALAEPQ
jgi:hypothetical protein